MIEQIDRNDTRELKETQKNWLNSLIIRTPGLWSSRLGLFMARLRSMTRIQRRRLGRAAATIGTSAAGLALLALLAGPLAPPAAAATINVGGGCTLADAITAANTDTATGGCAAGSGADTINLSANVTLTAVDNYYSGNNGLPRITTSITIQGNNNTIARDSTADDFRLFFVDTTGDLTLNDITLTGASVPVRGGTILVLNGGRLTIESSTISDSYSGKGGAIYQTGTNSQVTIIDSTLSNNEAYDGGGAFFNTFGTTTITGSTFSGNSAEGESGGAAQVLYGTVTITGTTFSGNSSTQYGGAFAMSNNSTAVISGSVFENNQASVSGGAIWANYATLDITHSAVISNASVSHNGGGIYIYYGDLSIDHTIISDNKTRRSGGGVFSGYTDATTISNSTFSNNYTYNDGGGFYVFYGSPVVTNTTFSANIARREGGGIYNYDATLELIHVTVTGNEAGREGGGVYAYYGYTYIRRSIISGNTAGAGGMEVFDNDGYTYVYDSVIGHAGITLTNAVEIANVPTPDPSNFIATSDANNIALTDILETSLADNSRALPTGYTLLTHNLVDGSPAVDMLEAPCDPAFDELGTPRPQGDGCDAGAVEFAPAPVTACFDEGSFEKTLILGSGMGSHTGAKPQVAVRVANPTNVITNYGQIVGKETAAYNGIARFTPAAGSKSHIWVYTPTAEAELQGAEWWYGTPLTPPTSRLWKASMFRGNNYPHQPRAFVMYPTYGQKELHWDYVDLLTEDNTVYYAPGWTPVQSRTIQLPGALPYSRDISVRVAAVDNDADRRPIKVTVRTGAEAPDRAGVSSIELTQMPVKPTHGKLLNIMHFFLNDVPAGTTEIVVEWSALAPNGDSFTVTGITANYECGGELPTK